MDIPDPPLLTHISQVVRPREPGLYLRSGQPIVPLHVRETPPFALTRQGNLNVSRILCLVSVVKFCNQLTNGRASKQLESDLLAYKFDKVG
jgi:hypothetical protein